MWYRKLIQLGILHSFLFLSALTFAEEAPSFSFDDFVFPGDESIEEPSNEFISATFDDLYNIFSNYRTLTDSQKEESWDKYKEKYVRWQGIVTYKGVGMNDQKRIGIRHKVGTNVELMFDDSERSLIKKIKRGDKIVYTGRLSNLIGRNLLLGLTDVDIEIINGVIVEELKEDLADESALSLQPSDIKPTQLDFLQDDVDLADEDVSEDSGLKAEKTDITFGELNNIFGSQSNLTSRQKKEQWNDYKGTHIEWKGIVTFKGIGESDQKRIGISHALGTNIEIILDDDDKDLVELIKTGDSITYEGKLGKLIGRNLLCNVVNVEIHKIRNRPISILMAPLYGLPIEENIDDKILKEAKIRITESMAPKAVKKEDLKIKNDLEGFVEISFVELDKIFGSENRTTESQKDKLWKKYRDKYIRWTGQVMYRGLGRVSGLRMGVNHKEGTDVELCFDIKDKEKVMQTKAGDNITYTGKLINRRGYILPYMIEEGKIEKIF